MLKPCDQSYITFALQYIQEDWTELIYSENTHPTALIIIITIIIK